MSSMTSLSESAADAMDARSGRLMAALFRECDRTELWCQDRSQTVGVCVGRFNYIALGGAASRHAHGLYLSSDFEVFNQRDALFQDIQRSNSTAQQLHRGRVLCVLLRAPQVHVRQGTQAVVTVADVCA